MSSINQHEIFIIITCLYVNLLILLLTVSIHPFNTFTTFTQNFVSNINIFMLHLFAILTIFYFYNCDVYFYSFTSGLILDQGSN